MAHTRNSTRSMVELRRVRKWVEEFIDWRGDNGRDIKRAKRRYYRGESMDCHRVAGVKVTNGRKEDKKGNRCT